MDWKNKTAFITGGVSGIGLGIAQAFSNAGMRLALSYRNEEHRRNAEHWFEQRDREIPLFVKLDVQDRTRFQQVANEVEQYFGQVHILVNNAGISVFGPTDKASHADYDWIMGVNFGGVVNGLISFIPKIKSHGEGGHIVNVASMAAYLSGPQAGIYTASKFAVRGLTESIRYNLAAYGIGVSLMCPGLTKTNAWSSALNRPVEFNDSGFSPTQKAELEQFSTAFDAGMDPLEVGEKTLDGITENRGVIFTHPEFSEDFTEIYQTSLDALPQEPAPAARLHIENLRREANRNSLAGTVTTLNDLT